MPLTSCKTSAGEPHLLEERLPARIGVEVLQQRRDLGQIDPGVALRIGVLLPFECGVRVTVPLGGVGGLERCSEGISYFMPARGSDGYSVMLSENWSSAM